MNTTGMRAPATRQAPRRSSRARMIFRTTLATALAGLLGTAVADETAPQTESKGLIAGGKPGLALRYRLETVDQDGFAEDAKASPLRIRLNYRSGDWRGFSFFGEYDYIVAVPWDDYNEGGGNTPDRARYPVVADPEGGDLNQAYIQWRNESGTLARAGRERIIYDNARFVGNVGWRQNEQTYDGVYVQHKAGGYDLQAAWVGQVNRIFGNDVPDGEHDNDTWLLNASKDTPGVGKLTAYVYDIDDRDAASFSTLSVGLRFTSEYKTTPATLGLAAEFAHQVDAHDNPVDYSANYYRVDLSAGLKYLTPYVGYESLGGNDGRAGAAFRTPLATLHAFNGWADKFLVTPDAGLNDLFVGVKGTLGAWSWDLLYHDFEAESGSASFGDEIDASLSRKLGERMGLLFKVASFDGDTGSAYRDTTKLWVQWTFDL